MIDTPLEIFLAGTVAGAVVAFLATALATGSLVSRLEGRISRLRWGLATIADLDRGPAAESARNVLDLDAREART